MKALLALLALLAAACLAAPARAQDAAPQPADFCAAPEPGAAPVDLDAERQRLEPLIAVYDKAALAPACRAWWQVAASGAAGLPWLRWQVVTGAALMGAGRPDDGRRALTDAYARLLALTPLPVEEAMTASGFMVGLHWQRSELDAALDWSERGMALMAQAGSGVGQVERLRNHMNHASLLSSLRRLPEAAALLDAAVAETQAGLPGLAAEHAGALRALAVNRRRQGQLDEALALTEREVAFRAQWLPEQAVELATARQNRATLLIVQGRYDEAEAALRQAIAQADGGPRDVWNHLSSARETLSRLLLLRGRAAEALAVAREALDMVQNSPERDTPRAARPLRWRAEAEMGVGDLAGALRTLQQGLALIDQAGGRVDVETELGTRLDEVRVLLVLNDVAGADAASRRALQALEGRQLAPLERATLLRVRAAVAQRQGGEAGRREALQHLAAADALLPAQIGPGGDQRLTLLARRCELAGGDCAELRRRRSAATEALLPGTAAEAALALADDARAAGRLDEAAAEAQDALAAAFASGQPELQWRALATQARLRQAQGRAAEAVLFGKLALQSLQGLRGNVATLGAGSEARYLLDKSALYRDVADWLLAAARLPEALEVLRLLKRSEQDDFNERAAPLASATLADGGPSLTPQEQALQHLLAGAASTGQARAAEIERLRRLQAVQRITPDELARLDALAAEQAAEAQAAHERLATALDQLRRLAADKEAGPASTPAALPRPADAHTLHAYLLAGPQRLSALLVSARGQQVAHADVGSAALAAQVAALLDGVRQRQPARAEARALYASVGRLIDAAARRQGARRVVLWLDGPLRYLPMGLLHDGRRHLAEKYVFSVTGPAAAVPAPASPATAPLRVQAWGVTQAWSGLPALPGVGAELCAIVDGELRGLSGREAAGRCRGLLPGSADADAYFTEAALRAAAPAAVVHIGTHFVLRPGQVSRSWLLLGDGSRLLLDSLRSTPLAGAPQLVTLSACDTAVPAGTGADGREVDGLAATLLQGGARQVLASLWRIDDQATTAFMRRFYTALAASRGDAAAALQRAQRDALRAGEPARAWAAFTLTTSEAP